MAPSTFSTTSVGDAAASGAAFSRTVTFGAAFAVRFAAGFGALDRAPLAFGAVEVRFDGGAVFFELMRATLAQDRAAGAFREPVAPFHATRTRLASTYRTRRSRMGRREVAARVEDALAGTGYRAVGWLGEGASSEVLAAVDARGAPCAVKILHAFHASSAEARFRLRLEARALAALDHPALVPVLDHGVTPGGRPFLVMPRLEGETLAARLRSGGPLAPRVACAILRRALAGLAVAHDAGVIHRDVKPANLFLATGRDEGGPARLATIRPRVVVLDFGIAKIVGAAGPTGANVLGTPRYLAPEQILGGAVDARADVYAAGIVLFEAIAGRSPYDASGPAAHLLAHVRQRPMRLAEAARVPASLDRAVARALAKSPGDRFSSARAFAGALGRAALDLDAEAR
jgi:serine/threonine-protein kinase